MARREVGHRHHILHYEKYWDANKDNHKLRQSMGMIALMDYDVHADLHRQCPGVPPLDIFMAQRVNKLYVPHPNPLQGIDNIRYAIEEAMRNPNAHELERQVAMLAIEAVTVQAPFIREGLIVPD